tara:strand:- start:4 stop:237 length:234 start_codon:yes stop_codon:yes gene_type:complete
MSKPKGKEKLAEIVWDNATGEASIVWLKEHQPIAPLPITQYVLLFDAMVDVAHDANRNMADLQRMLKLSVDGSETVH